MAARTTWMLFKRSFQIAALVGLIAGVLVFLGGHTQGQYIYQTQPMKMASIEALWDTENASLFLHPDHRRPERQERGLVFAPAGAYQLPGLQQLSTVKCAA